MVSDVHQRQRPGLAGFCTAMILPVPLLSPGLGMKKRRVIGFSRTGRTSQGRAPTTAANGAISWKFLIRFSTSQPCVINPMGSPNESWQTMSYANHLRDLVAVISQSIADGRTYCDHEAKSISLPVLAKRSVKTLAHCMTRWSTWPSRDLRFVRVNLVN